MRPAEPTDLDLLVHLMAEFYGEAGSPMDEARARGAFEELLRDPTLGVAWVLEAGEDAVGYLVVTLGFSLEYGGRNAFVDDLFVQWPHRGRGLGRAAIEAARRYCEDQGVRALHLEVARSNHGAERLYRTAGFESNDRALLTLRPASPPPPR